MFPVTDPVLVFTILALVMLVSPVFSEKLRIPDLVLLLGFKNGSETETGPMNFRCAKRSLVRLMGESPSLSVTV
jgi:hypothetical protein